MRYSIVLCLSLGIVLYASDPWTKKDPSRWSTQDVQQIVTDSPWTKQTIASFEKHDEERPEDIPNGAPPSGMTDNRGVSDGKWDGGVGRMPQGDPPKLPIAVRWDSAEPVRLAMARIQEQPSASAPDYSRDYVISVAGLIPAFADRPNSVDPQQMRAGLLNTSRLIPRGKAAITPFDAKIDAATGEVQLFFPRSNAITLEDKEVVFKTRFGSLSVLQGFRLKDMIYKGRLEL